jgi:hypothetical protein
MNLNILNKTKYYIFIFLVFVVAFKLLNYHFDVLIFPFQLEYREGSMLLLSSEIFKGNLPYTLTNQPYLTDVFGFVYPFLSQPFIKIFGVNFFSLRLLTAICIVFSSMAFYFYQLKYSISKYNALIFTIIFYGVNLFLCIPISRPDSLGFLFFIWALYLPVLMSYSKISMSLSIFISIIAFFTKSYFIIAFPFIFLYLFLFVDKLRALKYLFVFFACFFLTQILIHFIFDFYFIGTFSPQVKSTVYDIGHLLRQLHFYFFELLLIPSIIFILLSIRYIIRKRAFFLKEIDQPFEYYRIFDFKSKNSPFLSKRFKMDVNLFYFILGFILILAKLGGHTGQFGVYLIHFMSFPLLFLVSRKFDKITQLGFSIKNLMYIIIILNILLVLPSKYDLNLDSRSFAKVDTLIKNNSKVLSTPIFASVLCKYKKPVYASGLTEYFWYVSEMKKNTNIPKPIAIIKDRLFLSKINKAEKKASKYSEFIKKSVEKKYFNLILMDTSRYDDWLVSKNCLIRNYSIVDSVKINMFATYESFLVYVLKPKKNKI